MNIGYRPHVLILNCEATGDHQKMQIECAREVLNEFGYHPQAGRIDNSAIDEYEMLWVPGDVIIRHFLNVNDRTEGRIIPEVRDTISFFCNAKKPIIAPCMALPVVLESIKENVAPSILNQANVIGDIVVYPGVNTITTARPVIGKAYSEMREIFKQMLGLISRTKATDRYRGS